MVPAVVGMTTLAADPVIGVVVGQPKVELHEAAAAGAVVAIVLHPHSLRLDFTTPVNAKYDL